MTPAPTTLWRHAHLVTFDGDAGCGEVIDGALLTEGGHIAWVGRNADVSTALAGRPAPQAEHDLQGALMTPGLVDAHTHLVYGGDRAAEFELRLQGATYEEIARAGGGIRSTVAATRAAGDEALVASALPRVDALIADVDEWPLRHQFRLQLGTPTESAASSGGLAGLWADIRSLIRIQYSGDRDLAAVSPEGGILLRENIRLRLTSVRHAMIRGDEGQVSRELGLTAGWVQRYFNERSGNVRTALQQISELRRGTAPGDPPQIATSLEALRQARRAFERQG